MKQSTRKAVDILLKQYGDYKKILVMQSDVGRVLARAKIQGKDAKAVQNEYDDVTKRLQIVSDAMTFATPSIWAAYKYEAYQHEAQPIRTMHDFRVHCSKPGYICTKRFDFVNDNLEARGATPLTNTSIYPDATELPAVYATLDQLECDDVFMDQWRSYEYYREDGRVAKWENM